MDKGLVIFYVIIVMVIGEANYMLFTEYAGEQWIHLGHYVFWAGVLALAVGGLISTIIAVSNNSGKDMDKQEH